ncbi:hypothetical protein GOA86_31765 [Sinorhizobium meliloti]|uniref:hypothetical protein n=1 Tax=Rhizobium meliloti TaxID=382 RepID=UPI000FD99708|nr:hypothetical protein [Sinorhizobium meliloti]MDW9411424.1 hypothetical protein [Sinorhizobium meliloti]MDW9456685.1 hypothetical protein [Sinorhizobium meliloti]MDW9470370.1 hypothetical protein [Sinorhizobium meliloti]MDW9557545.1 hypothetical protein [Sinorhizobium meliloti]MDW9602858.1 hypothetical protein [Sinorhizobium meliloti]
MASPSKLQTKPAKNDSTLGKISFGETIGDRIESSTSKRIDGTTGMIFDRSTLPWDEHQALHRYFLEADGPRSDKYFMDLAMVDLLTTEFRTEDINPFEILDLHHAVLQLYASAGEAANAEASESLEDKSLLPWRLG